MAGNIYNTFATYSVLYGRTNFVHVSSIFGLIWHANFLHVCSIFGLIWQANFLHVCNIFCLIWQVNCLHVWNIFGLIRQAIFLQHIRSYMAGNTSNTSATYSVLYSRQYFLQVCNMFGLIWQVKFYTVHVGIIFGLIWLAIFLHVCNIFGFMWQAKNLTSLQHIRSYMAGNISNTSATYSFLYCRKNFLHICNIFGLIWQTMLLTCQQHIRS